MTDIEDAQKVIAEANQQVDADCLEEVREVLKKYKRDLFVNNITFTPDGRVRPQITVIRTQKE